MLAAAAHGGVNVEIGSFKGKSTIGVASIASAFNLAKSSASIHNALAKPIPTSSSHLLRDFERALTQAGCAIKSKHTAPLRARSPSAGSPHPSPLDRWRSHLPRRQTRLRSLQTFLIDRASSPSTTRSRIRRTIRVFVEDMLRSDEFAPPAYCTPSAGRNTVLATAHISASSVSNSPQGARSSHSSPTVAKSKASPHALQTTMRPYPHAVLTPAEFSALLTSTAT